MTSENKSTSTEEKEPWDAPTECPKCGSRAIIPVYATKTVVCRDCGQETVCK